ncbi:MAG TPA: helix-turn-helix domain-containing protein [Pseudolabrys sp.]|nr:helix-turn-helix domain-containing protein [Pseudolabrys sp.]
MLCTRWTMLIVRELLGGVTRFNDLRRGMPRMSPALLSQRLRELEASAIVRRAPKRQGSDLFEYELTEAGRALGKVVMSLAEWGQTWIDGQAALENADVEHLMWEVQRGVDPQRLPRRRVVINFLFRDLPPRSKHRWWYIFEVDEPVDVCWDDPGEDVDLYVSCDLQTLTAIWLGLTSIGDSRKANILFLTGDPDLMESMPAWLGQSPVGAIQKRGGIRPYGA